MDKKYFFNIVNTLYPEELQTIVAHANAQRNAVEEEDQKKEAIMMSQEMADAMFRFPFISVSFFDFTNSYTFIEI